MRCSSATAWIFSLTIVIPCATAAGAEEVTLAGSSTLFPVIEEAATIYYGGKITVTQGGSSAGIAQVLNGSTSLGMSSRELKQPEVAAGAQAVRIGSDGIALVVHATNSVSGLSKTQAQSVFGGLITTWKEVGGPEQPVVLISLQGKHGTTEGFAHFLGLEMVDVGQATTGIAFQVKNGPAGKAISKRTDSSVASLGGLAVDPNAITFAPIGTTLRLIAQGAPIKFLSLEGNMPTLQGVKNQSWPFTRPLLLVSKGKPTPISQTFIDFMLAPDGQALVQKYDYVPLE